MNNYLFQIIIFVFVHFAQIQTQSMDTSTSLDTTMVTSLLDSSISSITTTIESTPSSTFDSTSNEMTSPSSSYSTSTVSGETGSSSVTLSITTTTSTNTTSMNTNTSTVSGETGSSSVTLSITTTTSTNTASMNTNTSTQHLSSLSTSTNSSQTTPETTTPPRSIIFYLTYKYVVESPLPLKIGNITNSTVLASVQTMVISSFNLTNFTITVIRVEIRLQAKANTYENDMFTDILFNTTRSDCNISCIESNVISSTPTQNFILPSDNGTLVNVIAKSGPSLVDGTSSITTTPTIVNYQKGESPPGVAARLGMGLGITIIGILLIGEIIYFYRKSTLNKPMRQINYELPSYNNLLST